jgi:hypothetical protein
MTCHEATQLTSAVVVIRANVGTRGNGLAYKAQARGGYLKRSYDQGRIYWNLEGCTGAQESRGYGDTPAVLVGAIWTRDTDRVGCSDSFLQSACRHSQDHTKNPGSPVRTTEDGQQSQDRGVWISIK